MHETRVARASITGEALPEADVLGAGAPMAGREGEGGGGGSAAQRPAARCQNTHLNPTP